MCWQVEISATDRSPVQRNPTDYGAWCVGFLRQRKQNFIPFKLNIGPHRLNDPQINNRMTVCNYFRNRTTLHYLVLSSHNSIALFILIYSSVIILFRATELCSQIRSLVFIMAFGKAVVTKWGARGPNLADRERERDIQRIEGTKSNNN